MRSTEVLTDEATCVAIEGPYFYAAGWAKKHPKDKPNARLGLMVAYKRAMEDGVKCLERMIAQELGDPGAFPGGYPRLPF